MTDIKADITDHPGHIPGKPGILAPLVTRDHWWSLDIIASHTGI